MAIPDSTTKVCSRCGEEKVISEYYYRMDSSDGRATECKTCAKRRSSDNFKTKVRRRENHGERGEGYVISELRRNGIYAAPGKCSEWRHIDVVAWGCVTIEVKRSILYDNKYFRFNFGATQRKHGIRCDVVVLVCEYPNGKLTFHVFTPDDPIFYKDGHMKQAVSYALYSQHHVNNKYPVTRALMTEHQDKWELIEDARQRTIERLKSGS